MKIYLLLAESANRILFAEIQWFEFVSSFSRFVQMIFDDFRLSDSANRILFAARNNWRFGPFLGISAIRSQLLRVISSREIDKVVAGLAGIFRSMKREN
jgi:hypothetical protein